MAHMDVVRQALRARDRDNLRLLSPTRLCFVRKSFRTLARDRLEASGAVLAVSLS